MEITIKGEVYRKIPGFENPYFISRAGKMYAGEYTDSIGRRVNARFITPKTNRDGYIKYRAALNGKNIRHLVFNGFYSQRKLAPIYGVTQSLISTIVSKKRWAHVKD
jgi:predicted XRE-type DNA-binding protein